MTPPIESTATQNIATIAFGILATCISIFTAWQGYQTWRRLHEGGRPTGSGLDSRDFTLFNDLGAFPFALTNPNQAARFELEGHPLHAYTDVFELPADTPSSTAGASAFPGEARPLNPSAAPITVTATPA